MVPYIALTEAAADFDVKVVNMMKAEQMSAEYLKAIQKVKCRCC